MDPGSVGGVDVGLVALDALLRWAAVAVCGIGGGIAGAGIAWAIDVPCEGDDG